MKERLVGAGVLVLLAVLFVPELLSGPARPRAVAPAEAVNDVPTSTAAAMRTYRVELDHPASQAMLPAASAPPAPQSPLPSTVQAQSAPANRDPVGAPSAEPPAVAAREQAAPPARSEPRIDVLPAARPATPPDVPADASRAATREAVRAPMQDTPREMVKESAGESANQSRASSNASPPAAHKPAVPARPANSFAPIGEKGGWSIQLGSFASKANAEKLARTLRAKGIRVYLSQGAGKHRVRAGPFADRASADRAAVKLRSQGQSVSIIAP